MAYDDDEDDDEDDSKDASKDASEDDSEDEGDDEDQDDGGERWEVAVDLRATKFLHWRPIGGNVYAERDDRTTAH